jgi:hypothetical protein
VEVRTVVYEVRNKVESRCDLKDSSLSFVGAPRPRRRNRTSVFHVGGVDPVLGVLSEREKKSERFTLGAAVDAHTHAYIYHYFLVFSLPLRRLLQRGGRERNLGEQKRTNTIRS